MNDFVPAPRVAGGHRMTLFTWAHTRAFPSLPPPQRRFFDVAPGTRVMAQCHWQTTPAQHQTLIALHGLEGSSDAHYMHGLADKAHRSGFNVVLLNQRNCGGTEHLSDSLYHSGLTADPQEVIRELVELDQLRSIALVGYSLGGNVVLKLTGEYGTRPPAELRSVCAVSPTMDLAKCVDALERPRNTLYQWNFVRNLKRRMRRKARVMPGRFDLNALRGVHTVRGFDEALTAPHHGFQDASDYYHRASSLRVVDRITVPTLILSADDDPFVPADQFRDDALGANPAISVVVTRGGGHCGFYSTPTTDFDGYWAEQTAISFSKHHCTSDD